MVAPISPEGQERSKYNSLKGGLTISHILPCTEACLYQDICPVFQMLVDGFEQQTFVSTCAVEAAQYLRLMEFYSSNPKLDGLDKALIDELVMLQVRIERLRRFISLFPSITESNHQITEPYTLIARLKKKFIKALSHLL